MTPAMVNGDKTLTAEGLIVAAEEKLCVVRTGTTTKVAAEFYVNMPFKTVMRYLRDGITLYTPPKKGKTNV